MSVRSINYGGSALGQAVQNLNNQLTTLSTQLSSGDKSTNYAGMGVNEGFAIAARSQLANISAFGTTMTNVNTIISAANTALQTLSSIGRRYRAAPPRGRWIWTVPDKPSRRRVQQANFPRWLAFSIPRSATAIFFPATRSIRLRSLGRSIMNGTGTQAGLIR